MSILEALLKIIAGLLGKKSEPVEPVQPEPKIEPKKVGMNISEKSIKLIIDYEGLGQPWDWPGGESGVTIGYGYDLGYQTNLEADWKGLLLPDEIARLKTSAGLKGGKAKEKAKEFKDICITKEASSKVFYEKTLPEYVRQTQETFPGVENLPPDAQGALVSLVYNRGTSLTGERRAEMKAIKDLVPTGDLKGIAEQIRSMKRLWVGQGLDGLLTRRESEAKLVENAK
jgi:GH24 family phage-related lysozyme (muramidase)